MSPGGPYDTVRQDVHLIGPRSPSPMLNFKLRHCQWRLPGQEQPSALDRVAPKMAPPMKSLIATATKMCVRELV